MRKSRLTRYILYRHDGYAKDLGFTGSFRPVIIEFKRTRDTENLVKRWYVVKKKPVKEKLIVAPEDLEPLPILDLLDLGRRMRMRFFKLLNSVGEESNRIDKNMRVYPVKRMPLLVGYETALLMLKPGGVVEYEKLPYTTIFARLRENSERVILTETKKGKHALIITAIQS